MHATGGDVRRICDLFGLSIAGANRYASVLNHPDLDPDCGDAVDRLMQLAELLLGHWPPQSTRPPSTERSCTQRPCDRSPRRNHPRLLAGRVR